MADPSSRRKLAAILSADVVGYSSLMAANEAVTVETLKFDRNIIARLVVRRGERAGHSCWATRCRSSSQVRSRGLRPPSISKKSLEGHNIELEPERRMQFRIGVRTGRCDRGGRRHDLWGWRQHRRAHGGAAEGRPAFASPPQSMTPSKASFPTASIFWASSRLVYC